MLMWSSAANYSAAGYKDFRVLGDILGMFILMSIAALAAAGALIWRKIVLPLARVLELGDGLAGYRDSIVIPSPYTPPSTDIGESLSNLALHTGVAVAAGQAAPQAVAGKRA
jgi:hypothetical protein